MAYYLFFQNKLVVRTTPFFFFFEKIFVQRYSYIIIITVVLGDVVSINETNWAVFLALYYDICALYVLFLMMMVQQHSYIYTSSNTASILHNNKNFSYIDDEHYLNRK